MRAAILAATMLCGLTAAAKAAYTDSSAFFAQVGSQSLVSFPSYSLVTEDSFGIKAPVQVNTNGQLSGDYGCDSRVFPCSGAYRLTYTLPFDIIGFEGNLQYSQAYGQETPVFDVPLGNSGGGIRYNGFYGDLFGPTNTITLVWRAGITSTDDFGSFNLSSAAVIRAPAAVPEPASLAMLGLGIVAFGVVRRRSGSGRAA